MCSLASSRSSSRTSSRCSGSSPLVGSSRIRTCGLGSKATANPTRWRWPAGEVPDQAPDAVGDADALEHLGDAPGVLLARHAVQPRLELEHLAHAVLAVERDRFGQVPQLAAHLERAAQDVHAPRSVPSPDVAGK